MACLLFQTVPPDSLPMRPLELICLLQIHTWPTGKWTYRALAAALGISLAQAHSALRSASAAKLYDREHHLVQSESVLEFLVHGVKYAFPGSRGTPGIGMVTAYHAFPMCTLTRNADIPCVWPTDSGSTKGGAPIHQAAIKGCEGDIHLYELLTLIDVLRLNESARAMKLAEDALTERVLK